MAPDLALDVFILTFNCAQRQVDVPVFANHLYGAFGRESASLPEVVVFSLQEMAPLSHAFIGSYFMNPYFHSFESALNLAATKVLAESDRQRRPSDTPYTVVKVKNVGMTGIMLFARNSTALQNVQAAEVGFGAGDMANKGAVGLRTTYNKLTDVGERRETEITFLSTHLAAMEWNLDRRNRNWEHVVRGLVFADPKQVISSAEGGNASQAASEPNDVQPLLGEDRTQEALHSLSIYKPGTHLFVAGDLNYRLSKTSPPSGATFPNLTPGSDHHYTNFFQRDQLNSERKAGRTLHGLTEAEVHFPPTYKYVILKGPKAGPRNELRRIAEEEGAGGEARWTWAPHRWPGWCDRILYLDTPSWVPGGQGFKTLKYDALPVMPSSDHRAVFLRVEVPILSPEQLTPPADVVESALYDVQEGTAVDPRIRLPFPIDIDTWEHRETVKKWENLIGWSMVISQSKQGIMVFATVVVVGIGVWWYATSS